MQTNYLNETNKQPTSQIFFHILLVTVWTQHTVWPYLVQVIRRLPIIGQLYSYVLPALIIVSTLLSLPYILKKVRATDVIFILGSVLLILFSYILYKENQVYIEEKLGKIFLYTLPFYFVGLSLRYQSCKKVLFWASLCSVVAKFAYQLYSFSNGDLIGVYNMDAAYKVLPSAMFLIVWALEERGWRNWLAAIFGMFLVLTYGTRGPMLAVLILLCVGIYIRVLHSQKRHIRVIFIVSAAIILILFSLPSISTYIFRQLSEWFESVGFSTRLFEFILDGEMAQSSGREVLLNATITAVGQRPIIGYGIMGDRVICGNYCHNIFWEILCDFGVIIGGAFVLLIVVLIFRAIKGTKNTENLFFVLSLVIMVITKLFLSYSYIIEPYFFLMLGVCATAVRKSKLNARG